MGPNEGEGGCRVEGKGGIGDAGNDEEMKRRQKRWKQQKIVTIEHFRCHHRISPIPSFREIH